MRPFLKFADAVDWLDEQVGQTLKWLVLFASLISAGNALMRYTIHYSSNAWLEIQWYMFGAMFMASTFASTSFTARCRRERRPGLMSSGPSCS